MMRPHRRVHAWFWAFALPALLLLVLAGIQAERERPSTQVLPFGTESFLSDSEP